MKLFAKRSLALVLAALMLVGLLPAVSLPVSAEATVTSGENIPLDHGKVVSLPITIRNYDASGMLFEWDGVGDGYQEMRPFHNPYNTSGIMEPIPHIGVNMALGQKFKDEWDLSKTRYTSSDSGYVSGGGSLQYFSGETYDSRFVRVTGGSGWNEFAVWGNGVTHAESRYMAIRFRLPNGSFGNDLLYVKRNVASNKETGVALGTTEANGSRYLLAGTEDGWTTLVVDLQQSTGSNGPSANMGSISIGFNNAHTIDVSFIGFFQYWQGEKQNHGKGELLYQYSANTFINQDYCYRMDDPTISMVDPIPAIGYNLLMGQAFLDEGLTGNKSYDNDGTHVSGGKLEYKYSTNSDPLQDNSKYVTYTAYSGGAAAKFWIGKADAGMARYAAIRFKGSPGALRLDINGTEKTINTAAAAAGGEVLELLQDGEWKILVLDLGYEEELPENSTIDLKLDSGSIDIAYLALFRAFDQVLTSGYNYASNAHVFVFEDYSYRHDRVGYNVDVQQFKVWQDGNRKVHIRGNHLTADPTVADNIETGFVFGGTETISSSAVANGVSSLQGDVGVSGRTISFTDNDSGMGIGFRAQLMNKLNSGAGFSKEQLRYATVSYCVEKLGTAPDYAETLPYYIILDTADGDDFVGNEFAYDKTTNSLSTITLGYFDAVADGRWHVDVLDLSDCVSRSPNGETFHYKDYKDVTAPIKRIGIADGWATYGSTLQLAYIAMFDSEAKAQEYANAYSEAYSRFPEARPAVSYPGPAETDAVSYSVITDAYTAVLGRAKNQCWSDQNGNKYFRVGSNSGFELIDADWAYKNDRNYNSDWPNFYDDAGFGSWIQGVAGYTDYNHKDGDLAGHWGDDNKFTEAAINASGIRGSSTNSYGYIMGMTERSQAEDAQGNLYPKYRQEVVEYVAYLLHSSLNIPRSFYKDNTLWYSANFVQGDTDGSRFGYYDEKLPDGSENVNAMFPRDYAGWLRWKLGITDELGNWTGDKGPDYTGLGREAETFDKDDHKAYNETLARANLLIQDKENIQTFTDAAYYMLNTLFLDSGTGYVLPEYQYLELATESSGGKSYYCFDTAYDNVIFDFDRGSISNNGQVRGLADKAQKTTLSDGLVARYAFLPVMRELPEYRNTVPYLRDQGISEHSDEADSYYNRDFNFVMECHGKFTYDDVKDLYFKFEGDDDVYLYVNGECVMDLGGAHKPANQEIKFNDFVEPAVEAVANGNPTPRQKALALEDGKIYDFDFYYMERHGTGSNLRIETNVEIYNENITTVKSAYQKGEKLEDYANADFSAVTDYAFSITNDLKTGYREALKDFSFDDSTLDFYAGFDRVSLGSNQGTVRQMQDLTVTVTDPAGREKIRFVGADHSQAELMDFLDDLAVNNVPVHGVDGFQVRAQDVGTHKGKFFLNIEAPNWFITNPPGEKLAIVAKKQGDNSEHLFKFTQVKDKLLETELSEGVWTEFMLYRYNSDIELTESNYSSILDHKDDATGYYNVAGPFTFQDGKNLLTSFTITNESSGAIKNDYVMEVQKDAGPGLAYGETLTLSGVKYTIGKYVSGNSGEEKKLFSNTVNVRAGVHPGIAYHHLVNGDGESVFYAWKDHELTVPIADIVRNGIAGIDEEAPLWSDLSQVYRSNANGKRQVDTYDPAEGAQNPEASIDRRNSANPQLVLDYESTGVKQLYFKTPGTNLMLRATVFVFDVADSAYVLDYDGEVDLNNAADSPFTANDNLHIPGNKSTAFHEAITTLAPSYTGGHLELKKDGENLWPQPPAPEQPSSYTVTVNAGGNSTSGCATQTVEAGNPITDVTVSSPNGATLNAPSISPLGAGIVAEPVEGTGTRYDTLYVKFNDQSLLTGKEDYVYCWSWKDTNTNSAWRKLTSHGNGLYSIAYSSDWDNIIVTVQNSNTPSWDLAYRMAENNHVTGIAAKLGQNSSAATTNCININSASGENLNYTVSGFEGTPSAYSSYRISGTPTADVTVSFAAAGSSGAADQPARTASPRTAEGDPQQTAYPYYYGSEAIAHPDSGSVTLPAASGFGSFLARLDSSDAAKTALRFKPLIMDGTSQIYVTSRVVKDGADASDYLGQVDSSKEVEMYQKITVLPANVVYYEDSNGGINYAENASNTANFASLTVTEEGRRTNKTQSADQSGNQGYDANWALGNDNSDGAAKKISFTGTGELLHFDFTGTGFDLFGRTDSVNAPTIRIKIYDGGTLVKTQSVITEYTNNAISADETIYQIPVASVDLTTVHAEAHPYHVVVEGVAALNMSGWKLEKAKDASGKDLLYKYKDGDEDKSAPVYKFSKGGSVWAYTRDAAGVFYQPWADFEAKTTNRVQRYSPAAVNTVFYLDGIRIYQPLKGATQGQGANAQSLESIYYAETEQGVSFREVRDLVLAGKAFAAQAGDDAALVNLGDFDSLWEVRNDPEKFTVTERTGTDGAMDRYFYTGPNNELYLKGIGGVNQALALLVKPDSGEETMTLQIAARTLNLTGGAFGTVSGTPALQALQLRTAEGWADVAKVNKAPNESCYALGDTEAYFTVDLSLCPTDGNGNYVVLLRANGANLSLTKLKFKGVEFLSADGWKEYAEPEGDETETGNAGTTALPAPLKALRRVVELLTSGESYTPTVPETVIYGPQPADEPEEPTPAWLHSQGESCVGAAFADMPAYGHWAHRAIDWAVETGITKGTSETSFSPADYVTRAQVVTLLYRAAGEPLVELDESPFADVRTGSYYERAVQWAVQNGVTKGTSATSFTPERPCTRGEIVTLLYRFARAEAEEGENPFEDVAKSAFYYNAVLWAVEQNVTKGVSPERFAPDQSCTRAQVVTFLYRLLEE